MNAFLVYELTPGNVRSFEVQEADSRFDAIRQAEAFTRRRAKATIRRRSRLPKLYPQPIIVGVTK